ncbi:alpha-ketoacid dehydrogenase kinase [Polychaeton citri CBS 116435]|uniref:Protein-serine/threonine kinase n=1 Tax=Polychaeton citri CBS 116435 TaxID=1314669 RepID=A0A9P4QAM9_9PEZI|nr:alpha-ketoacid dehydrogenase kinase [Polychaeton citri CBS 116435]
MLSLRAVLRHDGPTYKQPLTALSKVTRQQARSIQTRQVTDGDIQQLASRPLHPLTLADLCRHGRPPLSAQALLNSANFTLSILPSRLAHRIQSLRALPYIVVANPNVSKIHNNYVHSLSTLLPYAEQRIETLEQEIQFTEVMADLVQTHSNTISTLARGFLEARKYITASEVTRFLDEHLRARIGTRLIGEQHIALHFSSQPHSELSDGVDQERIRQSSYIGVIDTALRPGEIIRGCEQMVGEICELKYGVRPTVNIIGSPDTTMAHIPMHLDYVITELLKNSFRATIEAGMEKEPIEITIAPAPASESETSDMKGKHRTGEESHSDGAAISNYDQGSVDIASGANKSEESANIKSFDEGTRGVTIRIRDRGGGISPENCAKLWDYGFTTFNEDEINDKTTGGGSNITALDMISGGAGGGSSLAGLGYGLPLGRAYAEYFGGGIAVQSLWGWGTDVYLSLRGVGKIE